LRSGVIRLSQGNFPLWQAAFCPTIANFQNFFEQIQKLVDFSWIGAKDLPQNLD